MGANGTPVDDIRNPFLACLRETKDGMFSGNSKMFYLWIDLPGVTFISFADKRVSAFFSLDSIVSAAAEGITLKVKMPDVGKKSKPVERKFTSNAKRAEIIARRINELKEFWEDDPTSASEYAESAHELEDGSTVPDRFFSGVDAVPGGGAFVQQWNLKNQPNPNKSMKGSMSDGSLINKSKSNGHANGFASDSNSSHSADSPVPLSRSAGSFGNGLNNLPSNGNVERNGSGGPSRYEMTRTQKLQVEKQGIAAAKAEALSGSRVMGSKINFDAFHCKYIDVTNPQYQPRVGVMLLVDRDGVHIVKDGGGQMHAIWRRSVHFRFEQIARTKPSPGDDEWRIYVKKGNDGGRSVFCYRFETSLPELIDEIVRPYLSQFDPHIPESTKTPPPLFDDKLDRERREKVLSHVDDEIRHSGRVRHLTHMLGISLKLVKSTRNEEELSAEVLDFMEAMNTFLLEGKLAGKG